MSNSVPLQYYLCQTELSNKCKNGVKNQNSKDQKNKLDFLNQHKQQFDWDVDNDEYDRLLEASESSDTNILPAELPGVLLQSDYDDVHAVETLSITEADIVAAAMENAILPHRRRWQR